MNNKLNKDHLNDFVKFMEEQGFAKSITSKDDEVVALVNKHRKVVVFEGDFDLSVYYVSDVNAFYVSNYYSKARQIKQGCPYCSEPYNDKRLIDRVGKNRSIACVVVIQGKELVATVSGIHHGAREINYCPMCGRKLGD
jgi:hypothetical protein